MAGQQPDWAQCGHDDCIGVKLPTNALCLAHAAEQALDAFDAELERIGEEGTVDARGVVISAELLGQLLAVAPREYDRPTFTATQFDRATFEDTATFDEVSFQGLASFGGADFHGKASFSGVRFQDEAWFAMATFQSRAEFGGATFQRQASFDGTTFAGGAHFEQVTFEAVTRFSRVTFQRWAWFDEAAFQGEAQFNQVTFESLPRFSRVTFQGRAMFRDGTFRAGADFRGATFQWRAWFDGAAFHGEAVFSEAAFEGETRFNQATFEQRAEFYGAAFEGEARFIGAALDGEAVFSRATFQGETRFDGAAFQGVALFDRATFHAWAWFGSAAFQGVALFDRTTFQERAEFGAATFVGEARFGQVIFEGEARFDQATFRSPARWDRTTFKHEVAYNGATFHNLATFSGAGFERARQFGPLLVARWLDLNDVVFHTWVQLQVAAPLLRMERTQFLGGAQIRARWASIALDDASLAVPSVLSGVPPFKDLDERPFEEQWAQQQSPDRPPAERWRPRLLTIVRADVAGLRIADVDLRACRFVGAHNLDKLRIEATPQLALPPPGWHFRRVGGEGPPIWRWAARMTLAEEQQWRATRPLRLTPGHRPHPQLRGWYPLACRVEPELHERPPPSPVQLAVLYRELRKGREDAKDEPGAADFYYGEMEMRRHNPDTPLAERFVLWLYWLTSGYSLRGLRALICLAVVVLALAGLLHAVGFRPLHPVTPRSFWSSLLYAAESTLSLGGTDIRLTGWGRAFRIVLRITGPVLLGLALLSVRNRVKR
jgi:uncharacterized protein YjbI with pentapeptide repeats